MALSSSTWRFGMELLSHVHTLRLYLLPSSSQVRPAHDFTGLEVALLSAPPALSCSWKVVHEAATHSLRLPLPLLLFDYSSLPQFSALADCIQVTVHLLPLPPVPLRSFLPFPANGAAIPLNDFERTSHDNHHFVYKVHGIQEGFSLQPDKEKAIWRNNGTSQSPEPDCIQTIIPRDAGIHADISCKVGNSNDSEGTSHANDHVVYKVNAIQEGFSLQPDGEEAIWRSKGTSQRPEPDCVQIPTDAGIHTDISCKLVNSNDSERTSHDNDHIAYQVNGIQEGFSLQPDGEETIWPNNGTSRSPEPDCVQTISPTDAGIHADISCKVANSNQTLPVPLCSEDDKSHGYRGDIYNVIESTDYENMRQSSQSDGYHDEKGRIASSTSNNPGSAYSSNSCAIAREDSSEVCQSLIRPLGYDCAFDHLTHETSLCFRQAAGENATHCHPLKCAPGAIEVSKCPFSCQHKKVVNKLHGALENVTSGIFPVEEGSEDRAVQGTATLACKNCLGEVSRKSVRNVVKLPCFDWREVAENWFGACCCSFGSAAEVLSVSFEKSIQLQPGKCLLGPSTYYVESSDLVVKEDVDSSSVERSVRQWSTSHFLAFGNGFMVKEGQVSKVVKWIPVRCISCASLIGAYPCTYTDAGLAKEGLHLFRCQVKISQKGGILNEAHSLKSFQDLVVEELKMISDENMTYRFLIRSLNSKLPLLQFVVLNYDALICTGTVAVDVKENTRYLGEITCLDTEAGLHRSVKVQFLDCTGFAIGDLRLAELWAKGHDAETVYMLEEFVDRLREELHSHSSFWPADGGLFQNFTSSFLLMKQD